MLRRDGCQAVLRATYVDATWSYVMTVGVAVLPSDAAAATGQPEPVPAAADRRARHRGDPLAAGVLVVRYRGAAAAMYDYSRQISASFADGPYLVMYAAGYADSRPRVPVASDRYSYAEMTSLAQGVAQSVAGHAGGPARQPALPGDPRMLSRMLTPGC